MLEEEQIQTVVAPIKLLNADGTLADFGTPLVYDVYDVQRQQSIEFPMQIRFPDVNMADETENTQNYKWILEQGDATEFIQDGYGLFTDAGRSEGFGFRQYLIENFVDLRSKDARITGRWKPILEEMLEEIGVAKIDYEKRADEVLYGIEIQQSTKSLINSVMPRFQLMSLNQCLVQSLLNLLSSLTKPTVHRLV